MGGANSGNLVGQVRGKGRKSKSAHVERSAGRGNEPARRN